MSEEYRKGYRDGFKDGYEEAKKNSYVNHPGILNPWVVGRELTDDPAKAYPNKCSVCGRDWGTGAWGYVCHNEKCPSKVTASSTGGLQGTVNLGGQHSIGKYRINDPGDIGC